MPNNIINYILIIGSFALFYSKNLEKNGIYGNYHNECQNKKSDNNKESDNNYEKVDNNNEMVNRNNEKNNKKIDENINNLLKIKQLINNI